MQVPSSEELAIGAGKTHFIKVSSVAGAQINHGHDRLYMPGSTVTVLCMLLIMRYAE